MAEWSIAAVLKTVVLKGTGGSNPSLSAKHKLNFSVQVYLSKEIEFLFCTGCLWHTVDYEGIPAIFITSSAIRFAESFCANCKILVCNSSSFLESDKSVIAVLTSC